MLSYNSIYFTSSNDMPFIKSSNVPVIGLRCIGSHMALKLVCSGVRYISMVNFDQCELSFHGHFESHGVTKGYCTGAIESVRNLPQYGKIDFGSIRYNEFEDKEQDGSIMDPKKW
ncbi:hypothetical protein ACHAXS_001312 [Conticribra weissflogii]